MTWQNGSIGSVGGLWSNADRVGLMFFDPDLAVSPEFLAEWNLCSLAMPPLQDIGRIVLIEHREAAGLGLTAASFADVLDQDDLWDAL